MWSIIQWGLIGLVATLYISIGSMAAIEFIVNKHRNKKRDRVHYCRQRLVKLGLHETSSIVWQEVKDDMNIFLWLMW